MNVLAFSADSTTLATGATDNTVVLHDVATGTTRATISTASTPLNPRARPAAAPAHRRSAWQSGTAAYDTVTGEPLASSTGLPDGPRSSTAPGTGSGSGATRRCSSSTPRATSPSTRRARRSASQGGRRGPPSFLPDGEILLAGSTSPMTVWDPAGTSRLQDLVLRLPRRALPDPGPPHPRRSRPRPVLHPARRRHAPTARAADRRRRDRRPLQHARRCSTRAASGLPRSARAGAA